MQGLTEIRAANDRATQRAARYRGTKADVAMLRIAAYDEGYRDGFAAATVADSKADTTESKP